MTSPRESPRILVYSPRAGEAEEYAALIRTARPRSNLAAAATPEAFHAEIGSAEILMGWWFPADAFRHAPRLRWIHKVSAGVEDVVYGQPHAPGVALTRSHGALIAPRMVEYVLGAIYAHTQRFDLAERQQRAKVWTLYLNGLAQGLTVGIAGLGDIGRAVAAGVARNGMRVIGWRRTPDAVQGVERVYAGRSELAAFVAACDVLVVLLPLTEETRGLFDAKLFAAMKRSAYLVNIARGAVLDERALVEALRERRIAGATLDVFETEPLPAESPLWEMASVRITPHVSGPVIPADVAGFFVDNLDRYVAGQPLERRIDETRGY
ncbi:MAG TPA: D-2-hydroxyacid dehydrogenase [Burkholderiales bacterium]|nr:D-2-hydroxyacid dehydrogenase [Burkholderiales bacterium]